MENCGRFVKCPKLCRHNVPNPTLQSTLSKIDTFGTGTKCLSKRECPCYRESNKGSKDRQGPTQVSFLMRLPLREGLLYYFIVITLNQQANIKLYLGGVYVTPGQLSPRNEFTQVSSHGSTFVYMIPPQNVMPARVTPA